MKLTFLGTSHGIPERNRFCSCTLVTVGESNYIVDMGAPVIDLLIRRGIAADTVKGIFLTHMHSDHTDGLPAFANYISWYCKSADPLILFPERCGIDALRAWIRAVNTKETRPLKYETYAEGVIFDDGTLRVTAVRTKHCAVSYAFALEAAGKRVVFTGDLAGPDRDFPQLCFERHCDLIICEAAHFSVLKAAEAFAKCKTERVIINHISPRYEESISEAAKLDASYSLTASFDGMELEL